MILLANVRENEKLIKDLEGFKVFFRMGAGSLMLPYGFNIKAPDTLTLSEFVLERITPLFIKEYPRCEIHIEDAFSQHFPEEMKLGYLRATYTGIRYVP